MWRGVPLPSRLRGLGKRRKLPQWGPNEFWSIQSLKNTRDSHKAVMFDISAAYIQLHSHSQLLNIRISHNIFVPFARIIRGCAIFSTPFGGRSRPPGPPPLATPMVVQRMIYHRCVISSRVQLLHLDRLLGVQCSHTHVCLSTKSRLYTLVAVL